jgi:glucose-6-phosphate isomerase
MGGSSLYPEVLERSFGPATGAPRLWVSDSTDPGAVLRIEREVPWTTTVVVPASKSGTTIEVDALLARALDRLADAHGPAAGRRVVPITDPGSPLDVRARAEGFRQVVHGDADVGGRYSALTAFGLLPVALLGMDPLAHVAPAAERLTALAAGDDAAVIELAVALAGWVRDGRDKLAVVLPDDAACLGPWIEQLVAESLGKSGRGLVPVLGESASVVVGADRCAVAHQGATGLDDLRANGVPTVVMPWSGHDDIAARVIEWELAVAIAGALAGIDPFDQPDVAAAKAATARVLARGADLPDPVAPDTLVAALAPGDYLGVLAYLDPAGAQARALCDALGRLRERLAVPVTLGIGPRYLHSTGQVHKGGPDTGAFLVIVGDDVEDAAVPGAGHGFSRLKRAQAAGDLMALADRGRRVAHVTLDAVLDLA